MNDTVTAARPRLPLGASLILSLSLAFFLCFFAFAEVPFYRYMVVLVFVLLLFVAVRSRLVIVLAALPCLLALANAESSPLFPLLLCVIAIAGLGGFALNAVHPLLLVASPILSYLLAFLVTRDPMGALWVLWPIPVALAAGLALRQRLSRTATVAAIATVLLLLLGVTAAISLYTNGITLSSTLLSEIIAEIKSTATALLLEQGAALELTLNESEIALLVSSSLRLIPAVILVIAEILSYLTGLIMVSCYAAHFPMHPLPEKCKTFRMSETSAILFLLTFLLSLFPVGRSDVMGILLISALNLFVILQPGLAVCGILRLLSSFRQRRSLPIIFLFIIVIWFSSVLPTALAFIGAVSILRTARIERREQKNQR